MAEKALFYSYVIPIAQTSPQMRSIALFLIAVASITQLVYGFTTIGPLDSNVDINYSLEERPIEVVKIGPSKIFSAFAASSETDWKLFSLTSDVDAGTAVTAELETLEGTDARRLIKTTVLETDLLLISWYRTSSPSRLESLVFKPSTGQVIRPTETLYQFEADYELSSYHVLPISGLYTYAITVQTTVTVKAVSAGRNGLLIVQKNGTVLMDREYDDSEWKPFGMELFSPTFSVMSLNILGGYVQVETYSLQGQLLDNQFLFNVSTNLFNILHVRTGDTSLFLYTVENLLYAVPYDLTQHAIGTEFLMHSFTQSVIFINIAASSLAPGTIAVAYNTLYTVRSFNPRWRTFVYDLEARDFNMSEIVLEYNSMNAGFSVAGVNPLTHAVAFHRCNESVGINEPCPSPAHISHVIFQRPGLQPLAAPVPIAVVPISPGPDDTPIRAPATPYSNVESSGVSAAVPSAVVAGIALLGALL